MTDDPITFDATTDVVTCTRHNVVHDMTQPCPACQLSWSLTVERFSLSPQARRRIALMRAAEDQARRQRRELLHRNGGKL
jgi:hypothetical protein